MTKLTSDQIKDVLVTAYRESLTCGKNFTVNVVLDSDDDDLKIYTWQGNNISEAVFNGQDKIVKYFGGDSSENLIEAYLQDSSMKEITKDCINHISGLNQEIEDKVIEAFFSKDLEELDNEEIYDILDDTGIFDAYEPDAINWAIDAYNETVWDDVDAVIREIENEK